MKKIFVVLLIIGFYSRVYAQIEPALPFPCYSAGADAKNNMTVTGNTTFTFTNITDFTQSETLNTITVNVESSDKYKLYIAGEMTAISASGTNTPIPINTFTISATNRGTSPSTITLSNSYLEVAQYSTRTTGSVSHVLSITRNPLTSYQQAPGTHTLTLHIRYCQY
jgi:hypothetical protein